jgi:predicted ATPase
MLRTVLQRVSLTDVEGFQHETAPISPFTLLIGANATGKSNSSMRSASCTGLALP